MNTADITCDKMTDHSNNHLMDHNDKNKWYDRVYLCWEDTDFKPPTTYKPIKGFNCYRYNSFEGADYAWDEELKCKKDLGDVRHTMIPICKWVPERYDRFILNYKLMGMYWLGNHLTGRGYNKFD